MEWSIEWHRLGRYVIRNIWAPLNLIRAVPVCQFKTRGNDTLGAAAVSLWESKTSGWRGGLIMMDHIIINWEFHDNRLQSETELNL